MVRPFSVYLPDIVKKRSHAKTTAPDIGEAVQGFQTIKKFQGKSGNMAAVPQGIMENGGHGAIDSISRVCGFREKHHPALLPGMLFPAAPLDKGSHPACQISQTDTQAGCRQIRPVFGCSRKVFRLQPIHTCVSRKNVRLPGSILSQDRRPSWTLLP